MANSTDVSKVVHIGGWYEYKMMESSAPKNDDCSFGDDKLIFIKDSKNQWVQTYDLTRFLDAPVDGCFLASSIDEAIMLLDERFNTYGPEFTVCYYHHKSLPHGMYHIQVSPDAPKLKNDVPFDRAVEVIRKLEGKGVMPHSFRCIHNNWSLKPFQMEECGIIYRNGFYLYDRDAANDIIRKSKTLKKGRKKTTPLYKSDIDSLTYSLCKSLQEETTNHSDFFHGFSYSYKRGRAYSAEQLMGIAEVFNHFFGLFSYRKVEAFQKFKIKWKSIPNPENLKEYPIGFIRWMANECKRRRPQSKELVFRKLHTFDYLLRHKKNRENETKEK